MCLLIALFQVVDDAPLIVAANRDELFARPAVPMTVLRERDPRVLGGRDELAGGTWLAINEQMFVIAESQEDALGKELRSPAPYRSRLDVPMKIFIMERIATLILATDPSFRAKARDPFVAQRRFYKLPMAIVCDALKIAYATTGRGQYKDVFLMIQNLRKFLNMQIRIGGRIGWPPVRPTLRALQAYWRR